MRLIDNQAALQADQFMPCICGATDVQTTRLAVSPFKSGLIPVVAKNNESASPVIDLAFGVVANYFRSTRVRNAFQRKNNSHVLDGISPLDQIAQRVFK